MNLKGIMLSKISQSEKDTNAVRYYLSVKSQKKKKIQGSQNIAKQKQSHRYRGKTSGYQ